MNVHLELTDSIRRRSFFGDYVLPILTHRYGLVSVILFVILVVSETYYQNKNAAPGTFDIGGWGTAIAFFLLVGSMISAGATWRRYANRAGDSPCRPYMTLTDEYIESGIANLWHQRFSWKMLTGFHDNGRCFVVAMDTEQIAIDKSAFKNETELSEVKRFLEAKAKEIQK